MVGAQCQAVVGFVVSADAEGDEVGGFDEGKAIVQFHAEAARGAGVIVNFENGLAEGAVSAGRNSSFKACFLEAGEAPPAMAASASRCSGKYRATRASRSWCREWGSVRSPLHRCRRSGRESHGGFHGRRREALPGS